LVAACSPKGGKAADTGAGSGDGTMLAAQGGSGDAAAELKKSQAFLAKNAKAKGVKVLPSGLQYRVERSGPADGPKPKLGDDVKVHYEGTLLDGTVFDSSYQSGQPAVFKVGEVIEAWNEALQLMRPGDVWYLYVPADIGYGPEGKGPIPGNAVMVFKVELLGVLPSGASAFG
jgi:peptidylprolyl isomerase/FKBP-type peptidyl-prolyl cis-trans isomerase FklB